MESIDLNPRYSSNEEPGKCVKCLAEEKLFNCMRDLLMDENGSETLQQKYQIIYSFLQSPELQTLCDETEKMLSDGNDVSVKITLENGKPKFEIRLIDSVEKGIVVNQEIREKVTHHLGNESNDCHSEMIQ